MSPTPNRPADNEPTKWCPRCQDFRPHSAFNRNRRSPDGLQGYCQPHDRALPRSRRRDRYKNDPRMARPDRGL